MRRIELQANYYNSNNNSSSSNNGSNLKVTYSNGSLSLHQPASSISSTLNYKNDYTNREIQLINNNHHHHQQQQQQYLKSPSGILTPGNF